MCVILPDNIAVLVTAFYRHWWTLQASARRRLNLSTISLPRVRRCVLGPRSLISRRSTHSSTPRRKCLKGSGGGGHLKACSGWRIVRYINSLVAESLHAYAMSD